MRRAFKFAAIGMMVITFQGVNISLSSIAQEQTGDTEIPQSVMEPIRVADNSINLLPKSPRPQTQDGQQVKGAPVVLEQGPTSGISSSVQPFQPQSQRQPLVPQHPNSTQRFQPNQHVVQSVTGQSTTDHTKSQSTYQPTLPVKPVSFQKSAPSISTQIEVPVYINLNQTASLRIKLQNSGDVAAASVKLIATIPNHARFVSAQPSPTSQRGQVYEFQVSDIGAKQYREVVIDLIPTEKKALEIGTEVVIENLQRFTVGVREPKIKLALQGPTEADLGRNVTHKVLLENTGDGLAESIVLEASFPKQLRCSKKNQITIPTLEPGQRIEVEMPSLAAVAGEAELAVSVAATGVETQTVKSAIQVFQPQLEIAASGPKINFLNREGIYSINLNNTGDMDATKVAVELQIPAGMKVTTISQQASVNPTNGNLTWVFEKIAAKSSQTIKLLTVATQQGQQDCVFTIRSQQTKDKTIYLSTNVVTRPELSVKLQNQSGPVQVGGKVQLLVLVENTGSSAATNLKVDVELPTALAADKLDGVEIMNLGDNIFFQTARLEPGQKREFRFVAVAKEKGEHVIRTTLNTADSERKLTSEGAVFVYELNENRVSESLTPAVVR
jgi:uncharacterized repeat protein (TIGR01451 family)